MNLETGDFRAARDANRNRAFAWEPSTKRTYPGWFERLSEDYASKPAAFLLVRGGNGLGIYGPETSWLVPAVDRHEEWMIKHIGPLITWVDLPAPPQRFRHTGDIGDCISSLPTVRHLGGGDMVLSDHPGRKHNPGFYRAMQGARYDALRPLLLAQPYIHSVTYDESGEGLDYDFADFRAHSTCTRCHAESHALHLGCSGVSLEPWITAKPSRKSRGRVVVARSPRYQNPAFPWRRVGETYGSRLLFIGLHEEHAAFQNMLGVAVEHAATKDCLEIAQLIAGSDLFIGNQSSPCWIAMGLGHRLIQETSHQNPDSIIHRPNAQFWLGGELAL